MKITYYGQGTSYKIYKVTNIKTCIYTGINEGLYWKNGVKKIISIMREFLQR